MTSLLETFEGVTDDGDVLTYADADRLLAVDLVRVVTTELAGGLAVAWREIALYSKAPGAEPSQCSNADAPPAGS